MDRSDKARELFARDGVNCCQAVAASFDDATGLDQNTLLRLGSAFGGGICQRREVCGAVSGLAMVAGLILGDYDLDDKTAKLDFYKAVDEIIEQFRQKNGSILCRDLLLRCDTEGRDHKEFCTCLVADAVELTDKMI